MSGRQWSAGARDVRLERAVEDRRHDAGRAAGGGGDGGAGALAPVVGESIEEEGATMLGKIGLVP